MHFIGGFAIAYTFCLFLGFFKEQKILEIKNKFVFFLVVVSFVALIAILWEFYEFLMFYFFRIQMQPSLNDALLDLFMGLLGGVFGALVFRKV